MRITTCLTTLLLVAFAQGAHAQSPYEKFELGVHYTTLRVSEKSDQDSGVGARFTYNLNQYLGVEAEVNALPQSREGGGQNEVQGFFGARAGIRKKNYGLFVKARPGYNRFYLLGVTPGPNAFEQGHTRFALDLGGVVEYYPNHNLALRLDVGNTMIRYKPGDFFYQRLDQPMFVNKEFSHNLQITLGFAFRF